MVVKYFVYLHDILHLMNTRLHELYSSIYSIEENMDPRRFVALVEPLFDDISKTNSLSNDDFPVETKLFTEYGIHLANLGKFNKAIVVLTFVANLFDGRKPVKKDNIDEPLYEKILLYRGVAYYNLKKYKLASIDLGRLVEHFPANAKYRNWYNKSVTAGLKIIQFILVGLFIVDAITYYKIKSEPGLLNSVSYSLMVGLIICIFIVDFMKRKRKRKY